MKEISQIIRTIETSNSNVNPTEICNEGWMTRLLVYYSIQEKIKVKEIDFKSIKNWTSEALLSSPFVKVSSNREGYTHTDMALGDFIVDYEKRGQIMVNPDAKQFGVIEAKMKSPLSRRTSNAKDYNQASRNITCIAHNTNFDCKTFFYVALPETKLPKKNRAGFSISDFIAKDEIKKQIKDRLSPYSTNGIDKINDVDIIAKVEKCTVGIITYEEWIELFNDTKIKETLNVFYDNCKKWNKL